jgi:two-component system response regulator HydG
LELKSELTGKRNVKEQAIRFCFFSRDGSFAEILARTIGPGYEVRSCDLDGAKAPIRPREEWDVAVLDASSAGSEGQDDILRLMRVLLKSSPVPPPIIAMVGDEEPELIRSLIENGAYETVSCPPDVHELRLALRRAHRFHQIELDLARSRSRPQPPGQLDEMIGCSESIQHVFAMARKVAACDVSVLITGETGTGKELLARAIHRLSHRASGPFIPFSCANLPETLIDDELFGHEKGAFTGANSMRRGRFEVADTGTIFLDEIGDLAPGLQAKLLRVLQERTFERLGSNASLTTDVRVICATNQDLEEMVWKGQFRTDLYFRLNVVQLRIPPLRARRDDIPLLAQRFLGQYAKQFGRPALRISRTAMRALEEYSWPGNVRELENVIQRALVLAEGESIEPEHLPERIHNGVLGSSASSLYEQEVLEFKRRLVLRTLRECGGNRTETARLLGITRGCLHRLINHLSILPKEKTPPPLADPDGAAEMSIAAAQR